MPTRRIQVSCPNCRTPQTIEAQQVFDATTEPKARDRILSGAPNQIRCPACGYQGPIQMPIVYHDAEKELLLTYVPQELSLPMHEQERVIGPLITRVVEDLPAEKRKAYLLQPRTMLTMQTMVDTVLEAEGVSKEEVKGQQARVQLIQRLANTTSEGTLEELARQEDALIDQEFFSLLNALVSNALQTGDEGLARRLVDVQQKVLPVTTYGKEVQSQNEEIQSAAKELSELGERLTRKDLVELVVKTSNETRLKAYVSLARAGMDYEFFRLLSERIDRARPDARPRLSELRAQLLELTQHYDEQVAQRQAQLEQLLEALLEEDDPGDVIRQNPNIIDEQFLEVVQEALDRAAEGGDQGREQKLERLVRAIEQLSAPPPEFEVINRLVEAPDDDARAAILDALTPDQLSAVVEMLMNVMPNVEAADDARTAEALRAVYRLALRKSMRLKMKP
ncbi:MAG TPA: CpXC domain-containing protein [Anaerolineales bacterium]|nr:CpXC domain-containing protein [Anaerolineales bacterium]